MMSQMKTLDLENKKLYVYNTHLHLLNGYSQQYELYLMLNTMSFYYMRIFLLEYL